MTDLSNAIICITGASSGIGKACASAFARAGARVLLCARRNKRLLELADELRNAYNTDIHTFQLDVRNYDAVVSAMKELPAEWQDIRVLINNAGLSRGLDKLHEGSLQDWEEMIDTNVKGLLYVSRVIIPGMVARKNGHVINIGSIAGREVYPAGNVYCASKHAVRALTQAMQIDLNGSGVRVSSVDPGLVETEFSVVRFRGDSERAGSVYRGITPLTPDDVADAVLYCATRPAHVNVHEMLLMPTDQATATIVDRRQQR